MGTKARSKAPQQPAPKRQANPLATRNAKGQYVQGQPGSTGGDAGRARRALNLATINGMAEAFKRHGRAAITKVAKQQPAIFLKLLVLLVPRELEVTQHQGVGTMSTDQIEAVIGRIEEHLARRSGDRAKVIEHQD